MLSRLHRFFKQYIDTTDHPQATLAHRLQLAHAALMVEIIQVDDAITTEEEEKIRQLLNRKFQLSPTEVESLLELASKKQHEATDYFEFTSLLNQHYSQQQKIALIKDLWSLAYADNEMDKYEEHLVRRLADLLHVPHHEFIKTKYQAHQG